MLLFRYSKWYLLLWCLMRFRPSMCSVTAMPFAKNDREITWKKTTTTAVIHVNTPNVLYFYRHSGYDILYTLSYARVKPNYIELGWAKIKYNANVECWIASKGPVAWRDEVEERKKCRYCCGLNEVHGGRREIQSREEIKRTTLYACIANTLQVSPSVFFVLCAPTAMWCNLW